MKEGFWMWRYWMRGVWLGIKGMGRIQLGSRVFHDGEWWFVSNWTGSESPTLSERSRWGFAGECRDLVPGKELRESYSVTEFVHRFRVKYRWYMTSWWAIDVHKAMSDDH